MVCSSTSTSERYRELGSNFGWWFRCHGRLRCSANGPDGVAMHKSSGKLTPLTVCPYGGWLISLAPDLSMCLPDLVLPSRCGDFYRGSGVTSLST